VKSLISKKPLKTNSKIKKTSSTVMMKISKSLNKIFLMNKNPKPLKTNENLNKRPKKAQILQKTHSATPCKHKTLKSSNAS
jgi:hypothetical protein